MFFSPFAKELRQRLLEIGGGFNAHLHLDRAGTLDLVTHLKGSPSWAERLEKKHSLIELVHQSEGYADEALLSRALYYTGLIADSGSTTAESFIDVTSDSVGLRAVRKFSQARDTLSERIKLRLGAYNPLGFRSGDSKAINLLEESLEICDFVGALPERDDTEKYPDHIGFESSCNLMYELALKHGRDLHVHVDQRNDPNQREAERLLDALTSSYQKPLNDNDPRIWLVHLVSPSRYDEVRFNELAHKLTSMNIGVICCPSAALSMRQLRPRQSPTSNSIARVLELCAAGVHVRIGCDNINDVPSPAGTPDLVEELINLSNAVRYYDIDILARLGSGQKLTNEQRLKVKDHLAADRLTVLEMTREM